MRIFPRLDLTDGSPQCEIGKHSIWLPQIGVKVPFQFEGRVVKYQHPMEASYARATIAEEYAFLQWLAWHKKAPPVGEWVYFKEVISTHLGPVWRDPLGAYGFEMWDARSLPRGDFTIEWLRSTGMVSGSDGAWNDLTKGGNIVNGYLIDVRRSWWDRLRYRGPIPPMPSYHESEWDGDLSDALHGDGSFPFRERDQAYQEFWCDGRWVSAEREVCHRADLLGFEPGPRETVVDLGCCTGGFLQYAALRGASRLIGIDGQREYIDLAKRLARLNGMNICYRAGGLGVGSLAEGFAPWLRSLGPIDHLLLLSMEKHLGTEMIFAWIDALQARHTYVESNAVKDPNAYDVVPLKLGIEGRGGTLVGWSRDRNTRALFRIDR